jgi:hypothetical protein
MLKRAGGQAARKRCRSPRGRDAAIDPITHGEGAIAELKRHGARRARCRGTAKLQIQLLLAATAINLKRLTTRDSVATNGCTGDEQAVRLRHRDGACRRTRRPARGRSCWPARTSRSSPPAYAPSPPTQRQLLRQAPSREGGASRAGQRVTRLASRALGVDARLPVARGFTACLRVERDAVPLASPACETSPIPGGTRRARRLERSWPTS